MCRIFCDRKHEFATYAIILGERQKVCFTVATEIVTLPGHLRVLFDKIYEGEPVSGNAWVVWQRVLQARTRSHRF